MENEFENLSEKYRKYIIKIILSNRDSLFILWGTDLNNVDLDYILINEENRIISFDSIEMLISFAKNNKSFIDSINTKEWASKVNVNDAKEYATYDTFKTKSIIRDLTPIDRLIREDAILMVDFLNLFSDYAYQTSDSYALILIKDDDIKFFIDYVSDSYLWQENKDEIKFRLTKSAFNEYLFYASYSKIIKLFESYLQVL